MNKKYVKLFLLMMISFFTSVSITSAKQFKKVEDLGTYITEWVDTQSKTDNKYNTDSLDNVIVIGTHVFTNFYRFDSIGVIQDASRSIASELPSYYYQFTMNIETDDNGVITKQAWDYQNPGDANKTNVDINNLDFLNIKYIDEKPIYDNKVNPTESMNEFVNTLSGYENQLKEHSADYYHIDMNGNNVNIVFDEEKYDAAENLVTKFENNNSEDYDLYDLFISALKVAYEGSEENYENVVVKLDDKEILKTTLGSIFEALGEDEDTDFANLTSLLTTTISKVEDLAGKTLSVTLNVITKDADENDIDVYVEGTNTFTINFYKYAKANSYFDGTSNGDINIVCDGTDKACTLVMNLINSGNRLSTLGRFQAIISNAFETNEIESATLNITKGNSNYNYSFTVKDAKSLDSQFQQVFKDVYGTGNSSLTIKDLSKLNGSTITFNFDTTKVKDKYNENKTSETYTFNIGEYVDTNSIIDKIAYEMNNSTVHSTPVTNANLYYHLNRNNDKITLDSKIDMSNGGKFYRFETVTRGLAAIIYGNQTYSAVNSNSNTSIKDILIIDNKTKNQYSLMLSDETSKKVLTLEEILCKILNVENISSSSVAPTMLQDLDISIKFVITDGSKLMPGMAAADRGSKSATYDITFNVDDFTFDGMMKQMFNASSAYFANVVPAATEKAYDITLNLNSVGTSLEDAKLFDKLEWYAGLFSTIKVTVGDTTATLDLTDLSAAKAKIAEMLNISDSDNVSALKNKEITFEFTVADDVNNYKVTSDSWTENTEKESETYTVKVKFTYNEVSVGKSDSIATALQTANLDVINLAKDADYSGALTINSSNANIEINGNGATINGNVTIASGANNVVINNLNIDGKLIVQGDNLVINGTKNNGSLENTIKGSINVENDNNVAIDSMKIQGTESSLVASGSNKFVIEASGTGTFTLTNSEISYINDGKEVGNSATVYSLLHLDGNSVISGNTFNIEGVKNPIEYVVKTSSATDVVITDNEFKGNNYLANDAHNIISFYGSADNSTITISNNHFEYANWAVRVSDYSGSNKVTYIITDNKVDHITSSENTERNDAAFMGLQTMTGHTTLTNITIKYGTNKVNGADYLVDKIYKHSDVKDLSGTPLVVTRNGEGHPENDVEVTDIKIVKYTTEEEAE